MTQTASPAAISREIPSILREIVDYHRERLPRVQRREPLAALQEQIKRVSPPRDFAGALRRDDIVIIAEIKKASPSAGVLKKGLSPSRLVRTYAGAGAAAVSVLTEPKFFLGGLPHLRAARGALESAGGPLPPLLRKDFLFDPYQVYQARAYGADALLLIMAVLDDGALSELLALTRELGMEALVEVHDERETERALKVGARVVGINNRDLHTFTVDLTTTQKLRSLIPADLIAVSESGIRTKVDINNLRCWGVNAVLIGETLVTAPSVRAVFRELLG